LIKVPSNKDQLQIEIEIQKRIETIDNGKEILTPYSQGMDEMLSSKKLLK
jgi:hypothetical protein